MRQRYRIRPASEGKEGAQADVAEIERAPEQRGNVGRKEHVGEERIADANVGRDCAAEVRREEDCAKEGGSRIDVEREADELQQPDPEDRRRWIAQLDRRLNRLWHAGDLQSGIHQQEGDGEAAENPAGNDLLPGE